MKNQHLLLALFVAAGLTPGSALDLTPPSRFHPADFRLLEGIRIPIVVFRDGDRRVEWQPPAEWELRGDPTLLSLRPPGASKPAMELRLIPGKAARAPERDAARDGLIKWAKPFLPADATKVAFVRELPSPFLLGGLPSRELTFTYISVARYCTTSIALVDLDEERSMAVVIYAQIADFDAIHTAGTDSMFRWNWIGPAPDRIARFSPAPNDPGSSRVAATGRSRRR